MLINLRDNIPFCTCVANFELYPTSIDIGDNVLAAFVASPLTVASEFNSIFSDLPSMLPSKLLLNFTYPGEFVTFIAAVAESIWYIPTCAPVNAVLCFTQPVWI